MSSTLDKWGGPAWAFQAKADALYDLANGVALPVGNTTITGTLSVSGTLTQTGVATFAAEPIVAIDSATTNAVVDALTLRVTSTGSPAAGLGTGLVFESEDDGPATQEVGRIEVDFATVTGGSEDTDMRFDVYDAGAKKTVLAIIGATPQVDVTGALTVSSTSTLTGEVTATGGIQLGADVVHKSKKTTISSAQLLAIRATPIVITDVPAAGAFVQLRYAVFSYVAGGTGYTVAADDDLMIEYTGGTDAAVVCLADNNTGGIAFTGTTSKRVLIPPIFPADTAAVVAPGAEGEALQVVNVGTTEWTGGDGTLDVLCVYDEITY